MDGDQQSIQAFLKSVPILQGDGNINHEVCKAIGDYLKLLQGSNNASALDTLAYLILEGKIDAGWHLYSQFTPDGGPIPLEIQYSESAGNYVLVGKTKESKTLLIGYPS